MFRGDKKLGQGKKIHYAFFFLCPDSLSSLGGATPPPRSSSKPDPTTKSTLAAAWDWGSWAWTSQAQRQPAHARPWGWRSSGIACRIETSHLAPAGARPSIGRQALRIGPSARVSRKVSWTHGQSTAILRSPPHGYLCSSVGTPQTPRVKHSHRAANSPFPWALYKPNLAIDKRLLPAPSVRPTLLSRVSRSRAQVRQTPQAPSPWQVGETASSHLSNDGTPT